MVPKQAKGDIKRKTFSIILDPDLMLTVKHLAVDKQTSISDIVEQAIKAFLAKKK